MQIEFSLAMGMPPDIDSPSPAIYIKNSAGDEVLKRLPCNCFIFMR